MTHGGGNSDDWSSELNTENTVKEKNKKKTRKLIYITDYKSGGQNVRRKSVKKKTKTKISFFLRFFLVNFIFSSPVLQGSDYISFISLTMQMHICTTTRCY